MKILKSLIIVAGVLGGLISCSSPFGDKFVNNFVISDTLSVEKIKISGYTDIVLSRTELGWIIDEGDLANQVAVNNLLYSLSRLEKLSVSTNFSSGDYEWIEYEVESGKKTYSFSFTSHKESAYLRKPGEKEVYRFGLKALNDVDLANVFSDDKSHWQNPSLIEFPSEKIFEIEVYPSPEWGSPFKLQRKGEEWILFNRDGIQEDEKRIDREKISDYTSYFTGVYFDKELNREGFLKRTDLKDVFYTIRITNSTAKETILDIYPHYTDEGEYDDFNAIMTKSGTQNLFFVNYIYLDRMFESYESFLIK